MEVKFKIYDGKNYNQVRRIDWFHDGSMLISWEDSEGRWYSTKQVTYNGEYFEVTK